MVGRDAGKLLLVFALAHCGSESQIEGLSLAPVQALETDIGSGARHAVDAPEPAVQAPSAPDLPSSEWQTTVARRIAASSFAIERQGERFEARNAQHGFRAAFDARGVRLEPKAEGSSRLRIGGSALGRGQNRTALEPASLKLGACRSDGALDAMGKCLQRLEGTRGKLTELWENREDGLEHSFIVHERTTGEGELSVWVAVENAKVTVDAGGTSARIADFGTGQSYRYAGLRAWDANGVALSARMQAQPGGLSLMVDDANAAYPITIDPVLAMPSWATQGSTPCSNYGISVSGAGDVNGDGFDDVIVGSTEIAGTLGSAYLYYGSVSGLRPIAAWRPTPNDGTDISTMTIVGPAGDVNGDGFDDIIIGLPEYANGQTNEGRVLMFHGGAAGPSEFPVWSVESNSVGAFMGEQVTGAGDVNADGFDDVIIGAPLFRDLPMPGDIGVTFVYHGSAAGLAASPAWTSAGAQFRQAFEPAAAGDVNGDGFDDLMFGRSGLDSKPSESGVEGRVVVFYGSAQGLSLSVSSFVDGIGDVSLGSDVAGAGDVNGDGFDDVIATTSEVDLPDYLWVFFGSPTGLNMTRSNNLVLHAFPGLRDLARAGDVNGDGFDDIIVGDSPSGPNGMATVYHGSASGLITSPTWNGSYAHMGVADNYGRSVASAGDTDGDGFDDIIVGAYFAGPLGSNCIAGPGMAFLHTGSPFGLQGPTLSTVEGNQASSRFGVSVAYAGDVNADGFGDVIVGATLFDDGQSNEGRVFVYHGTATGIGPNAVWTTDGNQTNAQLGYAVAGAGDVNGDGFDDIIIGSPLFDNGQTNEGRVWVYHGGPFGLGSSAAWTKEINQADARFGAAVASAGDVNGDGFDDVIVGATRFDNGQSDEGRAYVYAGRATGISPTSTLWTAESNQADANFGVSVASAGDVNGDGFGDVLVGADHWDNGQIDEGRAYYYPGSAIGPATTPAWTKESNQADSRWGIAVAGVGDFNGDLFDDIVVAAPHYNSNAGRVAVYFGGSLGPASSARILSGPRANTYFGISVAGAGDLNGDGYDDMVIGAYGWFSGGSQIDEGAAFVYAGAQGVTVTGPAFMLQSNQEGGSLGVSVSGGDLNGDGLSDLILGAHYFDNGQTDEGRVYFVY